MSENVDSETPVAFVKAWGELTDEQRAVILDYFTVKGPNLIVEYIAPPSGVIEALSGWAVQLKDKDGVTVGGVFEPFTPQDGTEGMFQITDTLKPDIVIYRTHIDNVERVVVL